MQDGKYIVVPFTAVSRLCQSSLKLADGVRIIHSTAPAGRSALAAAREWLGGPTGSVDGLTDSALSANHILMASQKILPAHDEPGASPLWLTAAPPRGQALSTQARLDPKLERHFALLLVASTNLVRYDCLFGLEQSSEGRRVTTYRHIGPQEADFSLLPDRRFPLEPFTRTAARRVKMMCKHMALCQGRGRRPRPEVALDMFYHALLEHDWRVSLLLMMVALESLFGVGLGQGEVAHQVSERAATFVYGSVPACLGKYHALKKLYRERSDFAHGSSRGRESLGPPANLCAHINLLEETVRLAIMEVLTKKEQVERFCRKEDVLREYLEERVLAPGRARAVGSSGRTVTSS